MKVICFFLRSFPTSWMKQCSRLSWSHMILHHVESELSSHQPPLLCGALPPELYPPEPGGGCMNEGVRRFFYSLFFLWRSWTILDLTANSKLGLQISCSITWYHLWFGYEGYNFTALATRITMKKPVWRIPKILPNSTFFFFLLAGSCTAAMV